MEPFLEALLRWLSTLQPDQVIWWAVVAVVAVLMIWKAWPAFRKLVKLLSRGVALVDTLAGLPDDMAAIRHQLEHNGGGSVKDAVVRTELAIANLRSEVADARGEIRHVQRQTASLKTSLAKTNRRLDEHPTT